MASSESTTLRCPAGVKSTLKSSSSASPCHLPSETSKKAVHSDEENADRIISPLRPLEPQPG